ncbi:hypothetical protein IPS70_18410 [Xanthomonas perforans]|nr:hypothetical protein [Xanthomonas perforans]
MAISACLFPILLNTATIFSQHLLRRSADSEVCIPRSNPAGAPRPKCTLALPCIIYGHDDINDAVNTIRQNVIRNHGTANFFCIAFDFFDHQNGPNNGLDNELILYAKKELSRLEREVPAARGKLVAFFRHRSWSSSENSWIGWERKRGKIIELCRLIARGELGSLFVIYGKSAYIRNSTYLMILDSDSWLEHGGLDQLIDAMSHQAATPHIKGKTLEAGYVIGCPRGLCRPGENNTTFSKILFYNRLEPQVRSIEPSFFQNSLGHHIFVGKGLYNVSAFLELVDGRLPSERVLSHDHLEGMLAIPAYISDVYFYQSYPQQYSSWRARQHRWIRGDVQTIPWIIFPNVRGESQLRISLSVLDRLKLATNIANHFTPVGQFLIFVIIALGGVRFPFPVTLAALALGAPALWINIGFRVFENFLPHHPLKQPELYKKRKIQSIFSGTLGDYRILLINLATLADAFVITVDATAKALWRMSFSKTKLLEWRPSSVLENSSNEISSNRYWVSQLISISVLFMITLVSSPSSLVVSPLFLTWATLPSLKWIRNRDKGFL